MERWLKSEIMASLAVVQGVFGFLRGYNWIQIGVDLFGQGLLLLPALGAVAVMHGLLVSTVALLYFLFAIGALLGKSWAWWPGITAVIINLVLVVATLVQGASAIEGIAWSVIPVILLISFFSQKHDRLGGNSLSV